MPKIVCVPCQVEYQIKKTGAITIEMFSQPPQPYKIWSTDKWKCPKCEQEVSTGFPPNPIAEHFQDDFQKVLEQVIAHEEVIYDYEL